MVTNQKKATILVADDEPSIIEAYKELLGYDYNLLTAYGGKEAITRIEETEVDLLILDLQMPDLYGMEVLKRIRNRNLQMGIILVTALDSARTAIDSLRLGAHEYVTKPFDVDELMGKVENVLRKVKHHDPTKEEIIQYGKLKINLSRRSVISGNKPVYLTHKEYELLLLLARNKGLLLKRDRILEEIWGSYSESGYKTLDTHIYSLRKKLGETGKAIVTIVHEGYKLDDA